ncbi:MAG: VOC family protein [Gammaproteobacteria bacterium]|nr:VOC family protein [Gammaproteobacteria bacterium]
MLRHEKINYVEYAAEDLEKTKGFFSQAFGWEFTDFGAEYTAFSDQGIDGGFYKAELKSEAAKGAALLVFYSEDIIATRDKLIQAGAMIVRDIFTFPGGQRFHFTEPSGNEFAVWTDKIALK